MADRLIGSSYLRQPGRKAYACLSVHVNALVALNIIKSWWHIICVTSIRLPQHISQLHLSPDFLIQSRTGFAFIALPPRGTEDSANSLTLYLKLMSGFQSKHLLNFLIAGA